MMIGLLEEANRILKEHQELITKIRKSIEDQDKIISLAKGELEDDTL